MASRACRATFVAGMRAGTSEGHLIGKSRLRRECPAMTQRSPPVRFGAFATPRQASLNSSLKRAFYCCLLKISTKVWVILLG
jgi:hypothetical protein